MCRRLSTVSVVRWSWLLTSTVVTLGLCELLPKHGDTVNTDGKRPLKRVAINNYLCYSFFV